MQNLKWTMQLHEPYNRDTAAPFVLDFTLKAEFPNAFDSLELAGKLQAFITGLKDA